VTELPEPTPARLLRATRVAMVAIAAVTVGWIVCVVHATTGRSERGTALSARLGVNDLALSRDDHLRHPGWGRAEQG